MKERSVLGEPSHFLNVPTSLTSAPIKWWQVIQVFIVSEATNVQHDACRFDDPLPLTHCPIWHMIHCLLG